MLDENIVEDHHSIMVIGTMEITLEAEKKDSGYFLSLERDLELLEEDLVTGSSNETIGSCNFEIDNLTVFTGVSEDNPSFGVVLNEYELLQKKELINSKEGETVMSDMKELVIVDDKEELACLIDQENAVGHTFKTATVMKNRNSILI